jgi:hypothetical protein
LRTGLVKSRELLVYLKMVTLLLSLPKVGGNFSLVFTEEHGRTPKVKLKEM